MKQPYIKRVMLTLVLASAFIGALVTPPQVARALDTTVEVGGATVDVGESASVDVWVRDFPEDGYGLGAYDIRVNYDPTLLEITDVSDGAPPFYAPIYNIFSDYVRITQFIAVQPGPTGDIRICDLEFTCLGEGEATLAITVQTLANTNGDVIPVTAVDGIIVQQVPPEPSIEVDNATVEVGESASVDVWMRNFPEDGYGLGAYDIRVDYDPTLLEITAVSDGDAPFSAPIYNIFSDYVRVNQFIAVQPGPTGDIRIFDLEFTCLSGSETTLAITIQTLANTNGDVISANPVDGIINEQESAPAGGGGGGGIGGGGEEEAEIGGEVEDSEQAPEPELSVTDVSDVVSDEGVFTSAIIPTSEDGNVKLAIEEDTVGLIEGEPVSEISITQIEPEKLPIPPTDSSVVGRAYDFGLDGATFDPPIELTFTYDPSLIPEGVAEEDLVIAMWDETTGEWVVLEGSTIDSVNRTVSISVSHFTTFAVIVRPQPATFAISDLSIAPTEVDIEETVTVSVLVTNTSEIEGGYQVVLKIDGRVEASQGITLAGGASQEVTFTTAKYIAGSYQVDVNGLTDSFVVRSAPVEPSVESDEPPAKPSAPSRPLNRWLLGGIIAGCAVAAAAIVLVVRRQKGY